MLRSDAVTPRILSTGHGWMETIKFALSRSRARRCLTATRFGMQQLGDESRHDGRPAEPLGASGGAVVKHLRPRKGAQAAMIGPRYLSGRPLSPAI